MSKIQGKLDNVLEFINKFYNTNKYSPSIREICSALSIKSTATCQYYLKKLEEQGYICRGDFKKRTITLRKERKMQPEVLNVPIVGTVTAGVPIFAYENLDGFCPISTEFGDESDLFILKVKGVSMINAGIFNGDNLIICKQNTAENEDIVVALTEDGEATVKRFFKKDGKYILHPENETLSDLVLDNVTILGTVKGLIRKY